MTDPFQTLIDQAIRECKPDDNPSKDRTLQRFAELIVQECYEWAKENGGIGDDVDYAELKQHFGLKE